MSVDEIIQRHCPGCGRLNAGLRATCLFCGAVLPALDMPLTDVEIDQLPPPPLSEHADLELLSPRLQGVAMEEMVLLGVTVHRCPVTMGIFLDNETFHFLVHRQAMLTEMRIARGESPPLIGVKKGQGEHRAEYINCPICREGMRRKNYANCSGVIVDICPQHGVWLDDGELKELLVFIQTGGHELAAFLREEDERCAKMREWRKKLDILGPDSRNEGWFIDL